MIPVLQTTFAGKVAGRATGNCFAAAIASVLEVPIEDIPNFAAAANWWDAAGAWLHARGLGLVEIKAWETPVVWAYTRNPGQLVLLTGKSPRGDWPHVVVGRMRANQEHYEWVFVHDPHPSGDFLDGDPEWISWFTVVDPRDGGAQRRARVVTTPALPEPSLSQSPKFTEASLLAALRRRHTYDGNGGAGRYAFLTHVRTGAAWEQQEIDAVAFALWPSEHFDIHAFEVKCSRTDWLREIHPDTRKSARARALCDTFTIVAPAGLVHTDELPEGWGLLEARDRGEVVLRATVKPQRLTEIPTHRVRRQVARDFVVAMLRASGAVPGMTSGLKRQGAVS